MGSAATSAPAAQDDTMITCQVSNQTILDRTQFVCLELIWSHVCLLYPLVKLILRSPDADRAAHSLLPGALASL